MMKNLTRFYKKKADLQEEIEQQKADVEAFKKARKETPHYIELDDLPEEQKFKQLSTQSKHLVDTIKMTAYRAETAMANSIRKVMSHPDEAHAPSFVHFIKLKQICCLIWISKH